MLTLLGVILVTGYIWLNERRSSNAVADLSTFCQAKGGGYDRDLVDGTHLIYLDGAELDPTDMSELESLIRDLPAGIDQEGKVSIDFRRAKFTAGSFDLRSDRVVSVNLMATNITDRNIAEVCLNMKRLSEIVLASTHISDESISHLEELPSLRYVNITDTGVSIDGVARLCRCSQIIHIVISSSLITDEKGEKLMAECSKLEQR